MEKDQKIKCTVETCKYQDAVGKVCELSCIKVTPTQGNISKTPEESMCSSYKCEC